MFGFLKRRKAQANKEEVLAVVAQTVDAINQIVEGWRERLEMKRDLLLSYLDERLVEADTGGLSFAEWADIELMAMLKNWHLGRDEEEAEVHKEIGPLWEYVDALGIRTEVEALVARTFDEVGHELTERAMDAANNEAARRGQPPLDFD